MSKKSNKKNKKNRFHWHFDRQRENHLRKNVLDKKIKKHKKPIDIYSGTYIEPVEIYYNTYVPRIINSVVRSYDQPSPPKKNKYYTLQTDNIMPTTKERVCKQRSERRRALFHVKQAGKGVAGPIKKRLTEKSKVRCY